MSTALPLPISGLRIVAWADNQRGLSAGEGAALASRIVPPKPAKQGVSRARAFVGGQAA